MKLNKIIGLVLLLMFSLSSVNAALTDQNVQYFSYDDADLSGSNPLDLSVNGNNGVNNGATTGATGKLLQAFDLDGTNDYIQTQYSPGTVYSIAGWFYIPTYAATTVLFAVRDPTGSAGTREFQVQHSSSNSLAIQYYTSANGNAGTLSGTITENAWNYIILDRNGDTIELYVDNVSQGTDSTAGKNNPTENITFGRMGDQGIQYFPGDIDETAIWNTRILTTNEKSELYASGVGYNFYFVATPTITTNLTNNTYLNYQPNISLTTTSNTNISYVLNGGVEVSVCNVCNDSSITPTLVTGQNNFTFISTDDNGQVNSSLTLNYDVTLPTITNNIPATSEIYSFNGSWFSCTDTNLLSCDVSIDGLNNAAGVNFSLTNNGNLSYNLTAIDLAGNSLVEAGTLFVNPRIYFSFNDSGTLVDTYTFGGRADVTGLVNYTIYDDGLILGSNNLSFAKLGYITQNFDFTLTTTTAINFTFNVNPAVININVYDRLTGSLLTNNISLELVGTVGDSTTTTTGTATLQAINGTAGDYQVIATSTGLETESVYFTFSTQENVTLNIYMFNASYINLGVVNIEVKDNLGQFIEGATAEALEWKSSESAYISVAQCQTGTNGQCSLNVELNNALYKFRATKNTITHLTTQQILTVTDTTITIVLQDTVLTITPNLNQLLSEFTEAVNNVTNVSLTRFEWADSEGVVSQACITTYRDTGYSLSQLGQNCTSATSGVLFASNFINNTYPITIVATVIYDGITYPIGQFSHIGEDSIVTALEESGLDLFVPIVFFFIAIALGIMFGNVYAALALVIALQWIAVGIAPRVMNGTIAVIITLIALLIGWGVNRK